MKQTLLIGNGISKLLNHTDLDWKSVLNENISPNNKLLSVQSKGHELVPYTHMYEDILLNDKYIHNNFGDRCDLTELKSHIRKHLLDVLSKSTNAGFDKVTKQLLELDIDNILTTNYEYTLAKAIEEQGFKTIKTRQQTIYSTRRKYHYINSNGREINLWYIHGELNYIKSIMLGYDHYCGSLAKISEYIKNGKTGDKELDSRTLSLKEDKDVHYILKKAYSIQNGNGEEIFSTWMDTFFFSDVHILGLGLDFQEIDLWWLLNKRYRYIKTIKTLAPKYNELKINNRIYYYGKISEEIKIVLDSYGVNTDNADYNGPKDGNWSSYYCRCIERIKTNIENSENK